MSLLGPLTFSARKKLVGVLGCCLNPCRKACYLYDCDLAFSNTVVMWGIGCCKLLPDFLCCAKGPKSTFRKLGAPSLLTTSSLRGAISARYFEKYVAVSSLVRRKNTLINREKSSLTHHVLLSPPATVRTSAPIGQQNTVQLA